MISSMTGYGEASITEGGVSFRVEIRSLNNRYYKSAIKLPERFQRFETEVDKLLRSRMGRGTVSYSLRIRDESDAEAYEINAAVLSNYAERLREIAGENAAATIDLASLLDVPGVCLPPEIDKDVLASQFSVVSRLTEEAVEHLKEMRRQEGQALFKDLEAQCADVRCRLEIIRERSPVVVEEYHRKLRNRVQQLLAETGVELDPEILAKEVAVYADRCDVSEEIVRLLSHLDHFALLCGSPEEAGRKLEFLSQEMLREANTIGSKANDAAIAREVVQIKSAIDRIKEQIQNVE